MRVMRVPALLAFLPGVLGVAAQRRCSGGSATSFCETNLAGDEWTCIGPDTAVFNASKDSCLPTPAFVEDTSVAATQDWYSITSSADGVKLAAVVRPGNIWTSTDSGVTWIEDTSVAATQYWNSITSSADGARLAATVYDGNIWTASSAAYAGPASLKSLVWIWNQPGALTFDATFFDDDGANTNSDNTNFRTADNDGGLHPATWSESVDIRCSGGCTGVVVRGNFFGTTPPSSVRVASSGSIIFERNVFNQMSASTNVSITAAGDVEFRGHSWTDVGKARGGDLAVQAAVVAGGDLFFSGHTFSYFCGSPGVACVMGVSFESGRNMIIGAGRGDNLFHNYCVADDNAGEPGGGSTCSGTADIKVGTALPKGGATGGNLTCNAQVFYEMGRGNHIPSLDFRLETSGDIVFQDYLFKDVAYRSGSTITADFRVEAGGSITTKNYVGNGLAQRRGATYNGTMTIIAGENMAFESDFFDGVAKEGRWIAGGFGAYAGGTITFGRDSWSELCGHDDGEYPPPAPCDFNIRIESGGDMRFMGKVLTDVPYASNVTMTGQFVFVAGANMLFDDRALYGLGGYPSIDALDPTDGTTPVVAFKLTNAVISDVDVLFSAGGDITATNPAGVLQDPAALLPDLIATYNYPQLPTAEAGQRNAAFSGCITFDAGGAVLLQSGVLTIADATKGEKWARPATAKSSNASLDENMARIASTHNFNGCVTIAAGGGTGYALGNVTYPASPTALAEYNARGGYEMVCAPTVDLDSQERKSTRNPRCDRWVTRVPTASPTTSPTAPPTRAPSTSPSTSPTTPPSAAPTCAPTSASVAPDYCPCGYRDYGVRFNDNLGRITIVRAHKECSDRCTKYSGPQWSGGCRGYMTGMYFGMLFCRPYGRHVRTTPCAWWAHPDSAGIVSGPLGVSHTRTGMINVGGNCCSNITFVE